MKKRVLSRILTVVLVCTMLLGLVGFAPMVETLSGSQQTIAAVDGSTGDIKDTPDAGGTGALQPPASLRSARKLRKAAP